MAFDVHSLVDEPDELQRLLKRLWRLRGNRFRNARHFFKLSGARTVLMTFAHRRQELGISPNPLRESDQ